MSYLNSVTLALVGEELLLDELLRDRASTLHETHVAQIHEHCAREPDGIDSRMAIETNLLGGNEGSRHIFGQIMNVDGLPDPPVVAVQWTIGSESSP